MFQGTYFQYCSHQCLMLVVKLWSISSKLYRKGAKITLKNIVEFRFPLGDIFRLALNVLHVKQHYSVRLKLCLLAVF